MAIVDVTEEIPNDTISGPQFGQAFEAITVSQLTRGMSQYDTCPLSLRGEILTDSLSYLQCKSLSYPHTVSTRL